MTQNEWITRVLKPAVFVLCLLPLAWLAWDAVNQQLGANPIEKISRRTGDWALRFLLITLAITPAWRLLNWNGLMRLRRMLGLFAFFYACLHFVNYLVIDQFFDMDEIIKDVLKRKYITVGFISFLLLIPLAVTSTNKMMKRLGGKRWQRLHQLAYAITIGGVVHYLWLVKKDLREPLIYAALLALLLGYRWWLKQRQASSRQSTATPAPPQ
ncbi:MAG: sulfoxide reductase heme-binding subunit YedZ [Gammaproteobacteria bacterium]|nr:sulfoxide reductase heme-binding subunit YedZ [Gammaproteobacteria bacterium]